MDLGTSLDPVARAREAVAEREGATWTGLALAEPAPEEFMETPRTGVSGEGGTDAFPWRFALSGEPTVSPYRRATVKRRRTR